LTARQIEAARRSIRHTLSRQGTLWIRVFPNRPVTAKPREVRMGSGTGSISYWSTVIKPGTVRFELLLSPDTLPLGHLALISASHKLPMPTYIVGRRPPLRDRS
jgi:large subunit ribosomal protein L16